MAYAATGALFVAILVLFSVGCAGLQPPVPGAQIPPDRIVALPLVARAYRLEQPFYKTVEDAALQAEMQAQLVSQATPLLGTKGTRWATFQALQACGKACADFAGWGIGTAMAIAAQDAGRRDYGAKSLADWRFSGELSAVRAALGTDLAMVLVFQEVSGMVYFPGNALARAIAANERPPLVLDRYGVACVVSLETGRMVWCNTQVNKWLALNQEEHARFAVTHLLAELYPSASPPRTASFPVQPRQGN